MMMRRRVVVLMGRRSYQNSPVCSVSTRSAYPIFILMQREDLRDRLIYT